MNCFHGGFLLNNNSALPRRPFTFHWFLLVGFCRVCAPKYFRPELSAQ
jgi:hypothetical protein